jgi:hypothetical protein
MRTPVLSTDIGMHGRHRNRLVLPKGATRHSKFLCHPRITLDATLSGVRSESSLAPLHRIASKGTLLEAPHLKDTVSLTHFVAWLRHRRWTADDIARLQIEPAGVPRAFEAPVD